MTSQNSGDKYSPLSSGTWSEAASLDKLDQFKSKVSNKPQQNFNQFGSKNFHFTVETEQLGEARRARRRRRFY